MSEISQLLYQLKLSDQRVTQLFEKRLGISLTRYEILQFLLVSGSTTQVGLQEHLRIDQAAITRHLKVLEEEGYVTRKRNPHNQREVIVSLQARAFSDLVDNPPQSHLSVKEQMNRILTKEEEVTLTQLLDKLVSGLETITFEGEV